MRRSSATQIWLILTLAGIILPLSLAFASGELLPRNLIGNGGGAVTQNGIVLRSAIGQPAAGAVQNGQILCSGFLCAPGAPALSGAQRAVHLPLVAR